MLIICCILYAFLNRGKSCLSRNNILSVRHLELFFSLCSDLPASKSLIGRIVSVGGTDDPTNRMSVSCLSSSGIPITLVDRSLLKAVVSRRHSFRFSETRGYSIIENDKEKRVFFQK